MTIRKKDLVTQEEHARFIQEHTDGGDILARQLINMLKARNTKNRKAPSWNNKLEAIKVLYERGFGKVKQEAVINENITVDKEIKEDVKALVEKLKKKRILEVTEEPKTMSDFLKDAE